MLTLFAISSHLRRNSGAILKKRIKRKEYATVQDFMADVDLVFQNAMAFNEDGSPVNDDARQLKVCNIARS